MSVRNHAISADRALTKIAMHVSCGVFDTLKFAAHCKYLAEDRASAGNSKAQNDANAVLVNIGNEGKRIVINDNVCAFKNDTVGTEIEQSRALSKVVK